MFEKRCYLCGGKLADGKCIDCGLDNTRNERITYRLNRSSSSRMAKERSHIESTWGSHDRSGENQKSADSANALHAAKHKSSTGRMIPSVSLEKKAGTQQNGNIFKAVGMILVLVVMVSGIVFNIKKQYDESVPADYGNITLVEDEDPYQFAERELLAEGEDYRVTLDPGEYRVGVHLPEGNYQIILADGSGTVSVDDYENSIYLWQGIGPDEEYDELKEWIDVRLYQGAMVEVSGNLRVEFTTDNGRTDCMEEQTKNPLTEQVVLKKGTELTAGKDFPAGVYDMGSSGEWTNIRYEIPLYTDYEDEEMNFLSRSRFVSADEIDSVYRNIVLPEGTKICALDADARLIPSEVIENEDYDAYYDEYR